MAFGMKGAALAAFGDIPAPFLPAALAPFGDKKDGVKLGDSTFNVFLDWLIPTVRKWCEQGALSGTCHYVHYRRLASLYCD